MNVLEVFILQNGPFPSHIYVHPFEAALGEGVDYLNCFICCWVAQPLIKCELGYYVLPYGVGRSIQNLVTFQH